MDKTSFCILMSAAYIAPHMDELFAIAAGFFWIVLAAGWLFADIRSKR